MKVLKIDSFNPYSIGFYSLIRYIQEYDEVNEGFNPYSTGFSSFIKEWLKLIKFVTKFQSLFYWILFFYTNLWTSLLKLSSSFNPYSTGFSSFITKSPFGYFRDKTVSILILLDSLLLWKSSESLCHWLFSFNPYSTGFSSFIKQYCND